MTTIPVYLNETKDRMLLLDQTLLPTEEKVLEIHKVEEVWEAIKQLRVRGAPAIGIAAAFGLYLAVKDFNTKQFSEFEQFFIEAKEYLASSRPTAVNLFWALDRMTTRLYQAQHNTIEEIKRTLLKESENIFIEDQAMSKKIGEHGVSVLTPEMGLLTHCNTGGLATSGYGTALAPIYCGHAQHYNFKVFADETRPLLQGSRLTAWELEKANVDVTVICDSMAAMVMKAGKIDAVLVGCDRIAANGDTANKIGTLGIAVLAKEYNIPMYVLGPTSTIDLNTPTGKEIEIELRDPEEIKNNFGKRTAPNTVRAYNPAFDITDAQYITAIIVEKGILYPPFSESIKNI